ncbi:MAG: methyltransferase domain-containing protein [Oligoflexia bacterium]|nr:methyltransferase domain-containing protein [Oligoflexia bacterium]
MLKFFGKKIVFEFDDFIEQTVVPQKKYFELLKISDRIIVGNNYLKEMASRFCDSNKIKIVNTTIPFKEYQIAHEKVKSSKKNKKVVSIVWIGSSTTMAYLEGMLSYFENLKTINKFKLVVISNSPPKYETINNNISSLIEFIKWDVTTYLDHLAQCDIRIMPLHDDDWARAKCGFKLIQYFGVGIPVVTSPLGINIEIVDHEINGFFASTKEEWQRYLAILIENQDLRLEMGANGQKKVRSRFDNRKIHKDILNFYREIISSNTGSIKTSKQPVITNIIKPNENFNQSNVKSKKMLASFIDYINKGIIVCPTCEEHLHFYSNHSDQSELQHFCRCTCCNREYPVSKSIARFVPSENYANSFSLQWNYHVKTQIDKFSGLSISKDRLISESRWNFAELKDELILECGSGAGRFTGPLCEAGANVISLDYSTSVEANYSNNSEFNNLLLLQASIYEMPFKEEIFDRLICLGVIQHTPNVELSFKTLFKFIKKGGKFCIDVYAAPYSYLHPRHIMRPFTKKMSSGNLYKFIRWYVPKLFPLSTYLHKIPLIGQYLARIVPVANWRSNLKLKDENMWLEWAILDTFDWLSPTYEYPQTAEKLKKWCLELNLSSWEISRERGLYIIRGTK